MKFELAITQINEPRDIKIAVLAETNNATKDDTNDKFLLIFLHGNSKNQFKKSSINDVKFYKWNNQRRNILLLANETKLIVWDICNNKEVELNFYQSPFEPTANECIISADWNETGNFIIATNNRKRSTIYSHDLIPQVFFDEERNEKVFILEVKEEPKKKRNHFYVFVCGRFVHSSKYEYGLYRLKSPKDSADKNISTSISRSKFNTIDEFYNNNSIIFNYDFNNKIIYLAKKKQNIIHCIKYNDKNHILEIFKTIDRELENIHNICLFRDSYLSQEDNEIAR